MTESQKQSDRDAALDYHEHPRPGKLEVRATKPLANGRDLARAYSPGVAEACTEIAKAEINASRYTARGNLVGVVTNGTAVLGLGNIGPLAAKPVMEGKAVLFKKFAGIDCFDIELNEPDPEKLAEIVCALGPTFGAINLEDIKAPDCFIVEQICRERMNIPVFHDDQHGTAIVVGAAAKNALHVAGKGSRISRIVSAGGGAAGIACLNMLLKMGVKRENVWLCDIHGLVHEGREVDMNPQKAAYAQASDLRDMADVIEGADMFLGLSGPGALTPDMVARMAPQPIVFALANPTPEITPDAVRSVAPDAIIATGRSDFPNQVNNVLCFPFIFRGALDVGATEINDAMQLACIDGHRGPRARHHLGRGGGGLPRRDDDLRPRLPDPQALRPPAGGHRVVVCGARGDGVGRRHPPDRGHRRVQGRPRRVGVQVRAADAPGVRRRPHRRAPHRLCRGRGRARAARRAGNPRRHDRTAHPDRPPGGDRGPRRTRQPDHQTRPGRARS